MDKVKWMCHFDENRECKNELLCDLCKFQPADEDKRNGKNPPAAIDWRTEYGVTVPYCPSCGEMAYSLANGVTFAKDTDVPSKWISVEDSMPEPMAWVLCACRANIIEVLRYDRNIDGWGTAGPNRGYMKSFVTHWMPLPEPPKVQEVTNGTDHV